MVPLQRLCPFLYWYREEDLVNCYSLQGFNITCQWTKEMTELKQDLSISCILTHYVKIRKQVSKICLPEYIYLLQPGCVCVCVFIYVHKDYYVSFLLLPFSSFPIHIIQAQLNSYHFLSFFIFLTNCHLSLQVIFFKKLSFYFSSKYICYSSDSKLKSIQYKALQQHKHNPKHLSRERV